MTAGSAVLLVGVVATLVAATGLDGRTGVAVAGRFLVRLVAAAVGVGRRRRWWLRGAPLRLGDVAAADQDGEARREGERLVDGAARDGDAVARGVAGLRVHVEPVAAPLQAGAHLERVGERVAGL